jgi:tetratricopeptide (TPR) repeat protein
MDSYAKEISDSLQLAIDAEDANHIHAARELYARCLALEGKSKASVSPANWANVRCRAWLCTASFRRDQGEARAALGLLRRAVRRWPRAAMVHLELGSCLLDLECFALAEQELRNALAIRARPETWSLLAKALREQERREESVECLHEVLALDPNYEEAHYNLGVEHRFRGEYADAIARFERAIAIDPDYAIAHAELGFTLLLQRQGSEKRALVHLRRAVALDAKYHWSRIYLAQCAWKLGRIREARMQYDAAVRLKPACGYVLSLYADFLSSAFGPSAEVEARFRKAVALDPDDDQVRYYYGKHLLRAERYTEARAQLVLADALGHPRALEVLHAAE